ncbi:hypothetical protein [Alteromonas sp. M12]|uniref:hypothetical protein n=1 Tax=Alteromonas sp. M12 TaxID=3135644 RepID=UPI00319E7585
MNRIDNRRILYDSQALVSDVHNSNVSPHWPKVLVTASMKNISQLKDKTPTDSRLLPLIP